MLRTRLLVWHKNPSVLLLLGGGDVQRLFKGFNGFRGLKGLKDLRALNVPLLLTGIFFNTRAEFSIFNFQFSIFNSPSCPLLLPFCIIAQKFVPLGDETLRLVRGLLFERVRNTHITYEKRIPKICPLAGYLFA